MGYPNVVVVPEQAEPDSEFSTVSSPNPENAEAFELAIEQSKAIDADVIVGTDPDADRVGVVVKDAEGNYKVLDGNQTGALLADYILRMAEQTNAISGNGVLIKTIVTSELGAEIAKNYGLEVIDTLTGFKFIGEKMLEFEQTKEKTFVFGYEESYGYLAGDFVRDKDAVIATMLICEMTAYYKAEGKNLYQALEAIWEQYGAYKESQTAITMKGKTGMEKIASIMTSFRESPIESIDDVAVTSIEDYETSVATNAVTGETTAIQLRKSNVLKYWFKDGSWMAIRPSGTEPKIKFYFSTQGKNIQAATAKNETMTQAALAFIEE
jgi:phosphoglucomutase